MSCATPALRGTECRPFQDVDGYWCVVDEEGFAIVGERFNTEKEAIQWMEWAEHEDRTNGGTDG
jgi:hypothetical protein